MKHQQFLKICELYQLGNLLDSPEQVHHGLLNTIWKIKTDQGLFAIKKINSHKGRSKNDYRISEKIGRTMANHNIPANSALLIQNEPLQIIDEFTVLVFNWIPGKTLSPDPTTSLQAKIIGNLFAKMHLLNLQLPELTESANHSIGKEKWQKLSQLVANRKLPFSEKLQDSINNLIAWETLYQASKLILSQHELASHRDLNPHNVIWINDTTPKIIDWEWAGLINPNMEVISTALEWSGLLQNKFNESAYVAFLQSYYEAGANITVDPLLALHNSLGKWLDWLAFNIERACDDHNHSILDLINTDIIKTFNLLSFMTDQMSEFASITQEIHKKYYSH